jgi:tRNA threonylcarbamoyladenosine modification (KEOPS) complex  Pcc1 subunit
MYLSKIIVTKDIDAIEKLFVPEDKTLNRSKYTIVRKKNQLIFDIEAEDATALKTAFNTITKVLLVWEKTTILTSKKKV